MVVKTRETTVAAIFQKEIDRQHINQRAMAQDLGLKPQLLSHQLNGRRKMGVDGMTEIADYLQDADTDFEAAAELFHTPKPLERKRRDNHPISKMVGQDKEEMERIEVEKKFEIWDLLTIKPEELRDDEKDHLKQFWYELSDEMRIEIAVLTSMCDRFGWNVRTMADEAEKRERTD